MEQPTPLHPNPKVAEALSFLQAAEQSAQEGSPEGIERALQQFDFALERLRHVAPEAAEYRRMAALALFGRTNVALRKAGAAGLTEALKAYDDALAGLQSCGLEDVDLLRNDQANVWIARAHATFTADPAKNQAETLKAFDAAIALRKQIAGGQHPEVNHAIAGTWINRAEVLLRGGTPETQAQAVQAFDEALTILRALPFDRHPPLRHQLATTLMNRGVASQALGPDSVDGALANLDEAVSLLKGEPALLQHAEPVHALACALINRAGLQAAKGVENPPQFVADSAREVLTLLEGKEDAQPQLAEVGLRARVLLVRAGGDVLDREPAKAEASEAVSELTDAVDDGLNLVRAWEKRRVAAFRPMAAELFVLGVHLYRKYQPQFLAEFALEMLDREASPEALGGSPEMYQIALDAVTRTVAANQSYSFSNLADEATARRLEVLQGLRKAESRLRQLLTPPPPTQSEKGVN